MAEVEDDDEIEVEEVETTFFGMDRKILKGIGIALSFIVSGVVILSIIQDIKNKNS